MYECIRVVFECLKFRLQCARHIGHTGMRAQYLDGLLSFEELKKRRRKRKQNNTLYIRYTCIYNLLIELLGFNYSTPESAFCFQNDHQWTHTNNNTFVRCVYLSLLLLYPYITFDCNKHYFSSFMSLFTLCTIIHQA